MLKLENTLFLMIDLQEKLVSATCAEKEVQSAEKLVKASQILELPMIVTEQYPKGLGSTSSSLRSLFAIENKNLKVFEKVSFSALQDEKIFNAIENTTKKQIVLFGIELHICVYQTAIELLSKGYEVFIVQDASKSRSDYNFQVGLELLKNRGVNITSVEIVLFELLRTSRHPKFKEIQALIK